jgi:hypothetical protein
MARTAAVKKQKSFEETLWDAANTMLIQQDKKSWFCFESLIITSHFIASV